MGRSGYNVIGESGKGSSDPADWVYNNTPRSPSGKWRSRERTREPKDHWDRDGDPSDPGERITQEPEVIRART
jgi:hypothetical protein